MCLNLDGGEGPPKTPYAFSKNKKEDDKKKVKHAEKVYGYTKAKEIKKYTESLEHKMGKNLLVDYIPFQISPEMINESMAENNGKLIVKGVLQRAEAKNQNGRIYPKEILVRESKKYMDSFIKESRALGELDHPDSSVVNLQNVSHNVLTMGWDGDDLVGEVEVLSTPSGNILKELFKSGIKLGISSRGLGSVKEKGDVNEVQDDFELIAFDFVSNPSTHGAFLRPMNENINNNRERPYLKYQQNHYRNSYGEIKMVSLLDLVPKNINLNWDKSSQTISSCI